MKIVFLSRYQGVINRGAENFVEELSKRLSKKHEVYIFSGDNSDSLQKVLDGDYDVVIPINGRFQAIKVSLGRVIGRYKTLITGHSGIGWDDILNIALSRPDVFVALTKRQEEWARRWAWRTKVVKIPNGIDLDKFSPVGEKLKADLPKPIILSVGALVWYKYHDRVIEAVSKLSKGSVLIVGEGSEKESLEKLGRDFLGERFKIISAKYEDMPKIYRSADLFTLPSWDREAFGIVHLEAMASGLGVVAPDDLSRHEIIGNAGLFTDVSDQIKYSEALEQALNINWSKKARQQAEKFSWDKIARMYEEVIKSLR